MVPIGSAPVSRVPCLTLEARARSTTRAQRIAARTMPGQAGMHVIG